MLGNDPLDAQVGKVPSGLQEIPIWEVALPLPADSGWMTGYPEVETDGRGGGETEAGSAGTQPR
jgi:hypothetical protein